MRQRYILGKMARDRIIDKYDLLDQDYLSSQMQVYSTNIFRAIQSGYSELAGFLPPKSRIRDLTEGESQSLAYGIGMPPMKIRMAGEVN